MRHKDLGLVPTVCALALGIVLTLLIPDVGGVTPLPPVPPKDDESNATFARELIPALLGRRAYGVDEVEAVADIAALLGRETAVRMLMNDPRFVDFWSDQLVDILRLRRRDRDGRIGPQPTACWDTPTMATPDPRLASWVRNNGPAAAYPNAAAWNMADLVRSAVALDDLSPVFRAYLFMIQMHREFSDGDRELANEFMSVYLNRNPTCLTCHNPVFSTSNVKDPAGNIIWQRLWAIPGHAEKALFGNYLAAGAAENLYPIWRADVRRDVNSKGLQGLQPWGISTPCLENTQAAAGTLTHRYLQKLIPQNEPPDPTVPGGHFPDYNNAQFGTLTATTNKKLSVWELEQLLHDGIDSLRNGYERFPASNPILTPDAQRFCRVDQVFTQNCATCHKNASNPSVYPYFDLTVDNFAAQLLSANTASPSSVKSKRLVANNPGTSEIVSRVESTGSNPPRMPPSAALNTSDTQAIRDWVQQGPFNLLRSNCNTSPLPDVQASEAFAYLTAANAVDGIWSAVMGYPLTIDHGFPRTEKQRDMLWHLTESQFVSVDWSLKRVLVTMLASDWFARRAPVISQRPTAYELPEIIDPWIVADPRVTPNPAPHQRFNGQGELASRQRVNTILRTLGAALGWSEPRRFQDSNVPPAYPSTLSQDLGQYYSPGISGFAGVTFQSLLALEQEAGLCSKTGKSVGADDWIDALGAAIGSFNASHPTAPITIGEAWSMLKDRLIQDPTIGGVLPSGLSASGSLTEEQAVVALMQAGTTLTGVNRNTSTASFNTGALVSKLREACGVVVKSPQFLLRQVSPHGYSDNNMPDSPRLGVCMPGETGCGSYAQSCGRWRDVLQGMHQYIECTDRSVRPAPGPAFPHLPDPEDYAHLCPIDLCRFTGVNQRVFDCVRDPGQCFDKPSLPPVCDPRIDECPWVDPLVPGLQAAGPGITSPIDVCDAGVFVARFEGGQIIDPGRVRMRRAGAARWSEAGAGRTLRAGDVLEIPFGSGLRLRVGRRDISLKPRGATKPLKCPGGATRTSLYVSVTGPSAAKLLDSRVSKRALSFSELRKGIKARKWESRAPTAADLRRIQAYQRNPQHMPAPTVEEIAAAQKNLEQMHWPGWPKEPFPSDVLQKRPAKRD